MYTHTHTQRMNEWFLCIITDNGLRRSVFPRFIMFFMVWMTVQSLLMSLLSTVIHCQRLKMIGNVPLPKDGQYFHFSCNHVWMELSFHCVCFNIYHLLIFFFSLQSSFSLQNLLVKTVHVALGRSLVYCCL